MDTKPQQLYPVLDRILKRINIDIDKPPADFSTWQEFIKRINNSFYDFEQERYLLERSMEISSKEMLDLNERFEIAQNIAHIGYWYYDRNESIILWSKETYRIFGIDSTLAVPDYNTVMNFIYEKDREILSELVEYALTEGRDYEKEIRIINQKTQGLRWLYVKGHPYRTKDKSSEYLLSGIVMDITDRKKNEEELEKLNQQLISVARRAGMSEVATSVLHNIRNVLNSVIISVSMTQEILMKSDLNKLIKVSEMINENLPKQVDYLTEDKKGKLIPAYLTDFSSNLMLEHEEIKKELMNLSTHIQHIKDIVMMQKDISGVSGVNEKVFLPDVIDLAVQMSCPSPEKLGITIVKKYRYEQIIMSDRSKLIQILVNLVQNAKDALLLQQNSNQKIMTISLQKLSPNLVEIVVEDNGLGIAKENLAKIFSMGFTTKPTGHGFGLHSCALAAKELGGGLIAQSDGEGRGAKLILTLPEKVKKAEMAGGHDELK